MNYRLDFQDILFSDLDTEDKYRRLDSIISQNLPQSLYRFRTFSDYNVDAFSNNRIYLSSPQKFNDPYDCLPFCADPSKIGYMAFDEANLREQQKDLIQKSQDTVSVACFTENIESHLMWAHYADFHRGFALEYDFRQTTLTIQGHRQWRDYNSKTDDKRRTPGKIYPVVYTNQRIDATEHMKRLHDSQYIHGSMGSRFQLDYVLSNSDYYRQIVLTKHTDWEYEKEWRIICVHFDMLNIYVELKPKAIIYGSAISPVHRKLLSFIARENGIAEKEAVIPNDLQEFTINIQKIKQ